MPFILSTGQFQEPKLEVGVAALSKAWGGELKKVSFKQDPNEFIHSLTSPNELVQIMGDAAMFNSSSGSWIEALGAWRQKIILLSIPLSSGDIPGVTAAYFSLCKELRAEIIGLIQIGGDWNIKKRKLDGLPWSGLVSDEIISRKADINSKDYYDMESMIRNIKYQII